MAKRLHTLGIILALFGLGFFAASGYTFLQTSAGADSLQAFSEAQNVTVNYNEDGEGIYHGVICSDGNEASVVERIGTPRQICGLPAYGAESCRSNWSVRAAAVYACQAGAGRGIPERG